MKLLKQAQRHKVAKAQRERINFVPVCLSASVPNQKGLTLLEIAISLAILSIAIVALANLFPIGLKASRRASNFSEASILAQRVIENIKRAASIDDADDVINATLQLIPANRSRIIVIRTGFADSTHIRTLPRVSQTPQDV